MAFYDPAIFEVHVLLVDHDMNALFETTRLLQFNSYKVTPVDDASLASSMLLSSQGNAAFNLVMVDVNTSNLQGFKLLHEAINFGFPVIVMASVASPTLAKCAIEDGAFLFMQKPTSPDELKYLWQHVLREVTKKNKEKGKLCGETSTNCRSVYGGDNFEADKTTAESEAIETNNNNNNNPNHHEKGSFVLSDDANNNDDDIDPPLVDYMGMRPKMCTEWTPDLHEKFMAAVKQLGDGRCFPKDILEVMNVPGLKRMQVASHLQKCRHGWQPSNGKHGRRPNITKPPHPLSKPRVKRYGVFPRGYQPPQFPNEELASNIGDDIIATAASNNNGNYNGGRNNMFGVQPPLDFGGRNDDHEEDDGLSLGLVANNFNGNDECQNNYQSSTSLTAQTSDVDAAIADANFWNSWIADFARQI